MYSPTRMEIFQRPSEKHAAHMFVYIITTNELYLLKTETFTNNVITKPVIMSCFSNIWLKYSYV